ncbi:MAG: arylsulfotransferase family protein [Acidimicrobiales bacterium]
MTPDDATADGAGEGAGQSQSRPGAKAAAYGRRQFLARAGGGVVALGLAGLVGYEWPHGSGPQATAKVPEVRGGGPSSVEYFFTRPDLVPPRVKVTRYARGIGRAPSYIFLAARNYISGAPGQAGLMIVDRRGRLVWFKPLQAAPFDFNEQSYRGRPVLTWWEGKVVYDYGMGTGEMADGSYRRQRPLHAGDGLRADLHELQLTKAGTVLLTAYQGVDADLSSRGGPRKGRVVSGHAQEIDIATGKVLLDWDSLGHVGLDESYQRVHRTGEWDYFHINSIDEMPDGNLLISARNTWALYKVDRSNGKVIWRLNGKRSDFTMGPGARFFWQHDGRAHGTSKLSVFDDGASPREERQSRGLLLRVDDRSMHVGLEQAYLHPAGFLAANQGNVQVLPGGRVFVGWGDQPYFSEFAPDGSLLLDGQLPIGYHSYRAYLRDWVGKPSEPPVAAARHNPAGGAVVYASWNGATAVRRWTALAGKDRASLAPVGSEDWDGFETAIAVSSSGPYYAVAAVDASGAELGRSAPVRAPT